MDWKHFWISFAIGFVPVFIVTDLCFYLVRKRSILERLWRLIKRD